VMRGVQLGEPPRITAGEVTLPLEESSAVLGPVAGLEQCQSRLECAAFETAGRRDHGHAVVRPQRGTRLEHCGQRRPRQDAPHEIPLAAPGERASTCKMRNFPGTPREVRELITSRQLI